MPVRSLVAASIVAALLLPCLVQAQSTQPSKKKRGKKAKAAEVAATWLLPSEQAAPSAKELAKRFPGAAAVVVLDAIQHEWVEDHQLSRVQRRLRFLTDAAAKEHGRVEVFVPEAAGPWSARAGSAQLVSSDGSRTELAAPVTEAVDGGLRIRVEALRARAGDLVELTQELECARPAFPPWTAQGPLPVLESRVIAIPPPIVTLRAYGMNLPAEALEPTDFDHGDLQAAGWRFHDLASLPQSALAPPREAVSGRLLLAVETYPDRETGAKLELDWAAWGALAAGAVESWSDPALAKSLADELGQSVEVPALLASLREKLKVRRTASWPDHPSAQAALDAGSGSSADLALLAAAVLEAAGVEGVQVVAARARARGPVGEAAPVDGNFSELVLRVGDSWLDPSGGGGVGAVPARFLGTLHAPLTAGLDGPVPFPAATSETNRIERRAALSLSPNGDLSGTSTWTWSPIAASAAGTTTSRLERPVDRPGWGKREGSQMTYGALPWRLFQDLDASAAPPDGLIDLGLPRTVVDVVAIDLPPGVTGAKLCSPAIIDAGPAGKYERTVEPDGRTVTVTRTFRLDLTRFGPDEAEALFTWLRRIQEAERATTQLQLQ